MHNLHPLGKLAERPIVAMPASMPRAPSSE